MKAKQETNWKADVRGPRLARRASQRILGFKREVGLGFGVARRRCGRAWLLTRRCFGRWAVHGAQAMCRQSMFVNNLLAKEMGAVQEEVSEEQLRQETEVTTLIHERILKVNTQDYGKYDPAPALVKPPFNHIPH
ncbi:hypothetical protein F0562_020546 [Nyssa sinensis]|uniref:Uncharacterized protein n=1 Tax=Nyssa sinensis TaxID=561372 RepID=A0A5J5BSB0_9ASTE|nr:hypothetical protein F0562_020546 [Nyssa sinensis]